MLGAFFSLLAAFSFALNNATTRRGVVNGTVIQGMALTVPIGVPLFAVLVMIFGQWSALFNFTPRAILYLSLAGCLHFLWGRYCNYRASKAIGANLQGPASQTDLLFTLLLAVWVLGEKLTPLRVVGIILVVGGPMLTMFDDIRQAKAQEAKKTASGWQPSYVEGYTFAVLSGTGYGVSPIFVRLGLQDVGIGASFAGPLVSYVAATLVFSLIYLIPGQWAHVRSTDRKSAKWFCLAGCTVFVSQMFRYLALSVAPVTVVQPIQRMTLVFRFFFSWWMNPQHEVFGGRVIVSTAVALLGAIILSISTDLVIDHVPMPGWLSDILRLEWP